MAVNPLNLLASLRPWRSAGISHLLAGDDRSSQLPDEHSTSQSGDLPKARPWRDAPDGTAPGTAHSSDIAEARSATSVDRHKTGHGQLHHRLSESTTHSPSPDVPDAPSGGAIHQPTQAPPLSQFPLAPSSGPEAAAHSPATRRSAVVSPGHDRSVIPPEALTDSSLDLPEDWPETWQRLLAKAMPSPLLWSYAELATDLLAPDDTSGARSAVLRGLISELGLPKGTSTFLPLFAAPGGTDLPGGRNVPFCCSRYFLAGLSRLAPRVVVLFGALGHEDGSVIAPYTQGIVGGRAFVYLPPLSTLGMTAQALGRSSAFLRSIINHFPLFPKRI